MKGLLLIVFIFISFPGVSQQLESLIDSIMGDKYKIEEPGAVILVAKRDSVIYRKAFGLANLEHNIPMNPHHVSSIGSLTKQFTSVAILILMEQGKVMLSDPIRKYIPSLPKAMNRVTVHHLLNHTSGIRSYTDMRGWKDLWRMDMKPVEIKDFFSQVPLDFEPGEKWVYSNSGYLLLGMVIEQITGMTYGHYLEQSIFIPLGLNNSYYGSNYRIIANRAQGYSKNDQIENAEFTSYTQAFSAGGLLSTVDDLFCWQLAINSNKLVKGQTIEKAFTDYKLKDGRKTNYGYGWYLNEINGSPTIEHNGHFSGYTSQMIYLPAEKVLVIILTNSNYRFPEEAVQIAALTINKPYQKIVQANINWNPEEIESMIGTYIFEDDVIRTISFEKGQFYSQRSGSKKLVIVPESRSNFKYEDAIGELKFLGANEVIYKDRIKTSIGMKYTKPTNNSRDN